MHLSGNFQIQAVTHKVCNFNQFKKILLLSETHRRPTYLIEDSSENLTCFSETDMSHRGPTCLIGDCWVTDMPHKRLTCLWRPLEDQHACGYNRNFKTNSFKYTSYIYFLLIYIYQNNVRTLIRHLDLWWVFDQACRYPTCLRIGMYVVL